MRINISSFAKRIIILIYISTITGTLVLTRFQCSPLLSFLAAISFLLSLIQIEKRFCTYPFAESQTILIPLFMACVIVRLLDSAYDFNFWYSACVSLTDTLWRLGFSHFGLPSFAIAYSSFNLNPLDFMSDIFASTI